MSATLGTKIRAGRLRWYCAPKHGTQVRVEDLPNDRWRFEFFPMGQLVPAHGSKGMYRVLLGHADDTIDQTALSPIRKVKRYFFAIVNDAGDILEISK